MDYKLKLGNVISTWGAPMGRYDLMPADRERPYLLHLTRVRLNSGGYDKGGAYWGVERVHRWEAYSPLFCAESDDGEVRIFVRVTVSGQDAHINWNQVARSQAKIAIGKMLPNARFYR